MTRAEGKAVFTKAESFLRRTVGLGKGGGSPLIGGNGSLTRSEVVAEFTRLYKVVRPKVKLTPMTVKFDEARVNLKGNARNDLLMLTRMGAVAPYGPLATGPKEWLSVADFGDALGYFLARMAEITHMPSRKWTPALQDE